MPGQAEARQEPQKHRRTLDNMLRFTSIIGEDSVFTGSFSGSDNYVINGTVKGKCDLSGTLVVMETGVWKGDIKAALVVIAGTVNGNIVATEKLELRSSARIQGNITSPVLAMASGAVYDGELHMQHQTQVTRFEERRAESRGAET